MATLTLTLSDAAMAELRDAFGENYRATLPNGSPNPQTKAQYSRQQLIDWIKTYIRDYRRRQAALAAAADEPDIT